VSSRHVRLLALAPTSAHGRRVPARAKVILKISDQLIDKVLAQDQELFIIESSIDEHPRLRRDTPPRNPSRAPMRHAPNRSRTPFAAARPALRSARAVRFLATRNAAKPMPIPL